MAAIRTLIVAASTLNAELLRSGLSIQPGLDIVETVETLGEVFEHARNCDVIVLHAEYPPGDIVDIVRLLRTELPNVRVVISRVPDVPQDIVLYLEAGATGYVRVGEPFSQLVRVIQTVHDGAALIDPEVAHHLIEHFTAISRQLAAGSQPAEISELAARRLTERQTEVLALIAHGMSNQEIANELYIEIGTVKNHVHNILRALELEDREQAANWFQRNAAALTFSDSPSDSVAAFGSASDLSGRLAGLRTTLDDLSERFGWPVGHVWVLDQQTKIMKPSRIWTVDDAAIRQPFIRATQRRNLNWHEGIIGQVQATGEPLWSADLSKEADFVRADAAAAAGLRAGLFIPLVAEGQLVGVMEFFSAESSVPEPEAIIRGATDMSWRVRALRRDPDASLR